MFFFVDSRSATDSASYDKGKLFEGLVRELVDGLGFGNIDLRVRKAGKEYDIRAKAKLGERPLIGQAKALATSVRSSDISEFVGSLDLEEFTDDTLGLFISTSEFTPDAIEYLERLKKAKRERIEVIVADGILE